MRKYLLHILIISFVFLLVSTAHVASYAGEIENAKEEVRNNPDDAKAHYNLGLAYKKSGMNKKAIESYKQAVRIDPDYRDAHYNLGVAYISLSDRGSAMGQMMILRRLDYVLSYELYNLVEEKFKEEHPP